MQFFVQNISSLKAKAQESFQKWGRAIGSRNPKDAEKYAKELLERLNALYAYVKANLSLAQQLEYHFNENLNKNRLAIQQLGFTNLREIPLQIEALKSVLKGFDGNIEPTAYNLSETIKQKSTMNNVEYERVEELLGRMWQAFNGMEKLITTDMNILAGDIRKLAKDRKYPEFKKLIDDIIKAEKELAKLK